MKQPAPPPNGITYLKVHEDPEGVLRELRRNAAERLRALQGEVPTGRFDLPGLWASPELYPTGPGIDTGDIKLV